MRKQLSLLFMAAVLATGASSQQTSDNLVLVEGGPWTPAISRPPGTGDTIASFWIGRSEVTQREWRDVMGENPSAFPDDHRPVEMVSWYDCIEYCNRRSLQEGLPPYYTIDKNTRDADNQNPNDDLGWTVTINPGATGYRLPTEAEWEYAARGGRQSQRLTYSGGNDVTAVAWFWQNSGDVFLTGLWNWPALEKNQNRTQPVGTKQPNELGLYDMSGNVREWCWDWFEDLAGSGVPRGLVRTWKGGGWMGGDFCCEPSFRAGFEANSRGYDQGFRVCRDDA